MKKSALAIHGGAGTIRKSQMTPELEAEYRLGLDGALKAGWEVLRSGGSALDAVEAAVVSLEDFPLFNAGRGAVFTHDGKIELDAAIMDGHLHKAGAVASVNNIKNPVTLARLVMERSQHVLLAGESANQFGQEMDIEIAPDDYFFTEHRWLQLQDAIATGRIQLDHGTSDVQMAAGTAGSYDTSPKGTVGAVACDERGRLAAATSTGGMTNKKFGRVGDTPIVGAGTYADDSTCAVSCTGHGEFFMRAVTAYDVAARMNYKGISLEQAALEAIDQVTKLGGEGGLIAVDGLGNISTPFNCEGMYRGRISSDGSAVIEIY
jgi:beta-aspartyl-peptidase (threonine type)